MVCAGALACSLTPASSAGARSASNTAYAWGDNSYGQLGDGTTDNSDVPVQVQGLRGVRALAQAGRHTLALLENGMVMAWGENFFGQLGDGTTTNSAVPVAVAGVSEAVAVAAGEGHSLAVLKDGKVLAWGENSHGQLGDGTTEDSDVPVAVSGLSEVAAVAAGESFSLALLKDGTIMAWGENSLGQLGDGSHQGSDVPVPVAESLPAVAISAGLRHSLALLSAGTVVAWGDNELGELGDDSENDSAIPVAVGGLAEVTAISAGEYDSLALQHGGVVMAWGDNEDGQLGDGSHDGPQLCGFPEAFPCSRTPVRVSGLSDAIAIAAGSQSLAALSSGAVVAWGPNIAGQLGSGTSDGPEFCTPFANPCSTLPVLASTPGLSLGVSAGMEVGLAFGPTPPTGELPELGRCLPVSGDGAYVAARCTRPSRRHAGKFEWSPGPGPRAGFTDRLSNPILETTDRSVIACALALTEGEYTGPKSESISRATMSGCHLEGSDASCQSSPGEDGVITSSLPLQGELGLILAGGGRQVGWSMKPEPPATSLMSFVCGAAPAMESATLEGSVIGSAAPVDGMVASFDLRYRQRRGRQVPEFFTPAVREVLTLATVFPDGSRESEQAGLGAKGVLLDEEPLEIKAQP